MTVSKNNRGKLWVTKLKKKLDYWWNWIICFPLFSTTWSNTVSTNAQMGLAWSNTSQRNRSGKVILNGLLANCPCRCSPELLGCSFLTWDNGNGVFLPGHHTDVLLDDRGDEALEDGDITPHGALVSHTDCVRLPEHWNGKKRMFF